MNTIKIYCQIISVLLLTSVFSYGAKVMEGFSVPLEIRSATIFQNHLYLATDGGIRCFYSEEQSVVYTADDGLETTSFYAIASNKEALYAVSSDGLIAKQTTIGGNFTIINRAFLSSGSDVLPGMILIEDSVMVLAFNDKLAFIDLVSQRSLISLTSIASHRLSTDQITAMNIKGDSLYVAIKDKVYARKMNWSHMAEDMFLADPSTWINFPISPSTDTIQSMTWYQDSLIVRSEKGSFYYDDEGEKTELSLNKATLLFEGKSLKDSLLFNNDSSLVEWVLSIENGYYFVGPSTIVYKQGSKTTDLSEWTQYSLGRTFQIMALESGYIFAASPYGYGALSDGLSWTPKYKINFTPYLFENESIIHKMKSISIDKNGNMLYTLWGGGFILLKEYGVSFYKYITVGMSCISEFLDDYIIPVASTPAPDQSGFFISYWSSSLSGFAFVDLEGEVSCANNVGSTSYPGPLVVKVSEEDSDQWLLYSSAGITRDVSGEGSLDVFTFTKPSKTGGRFVDVELKTYDGPNKEHIVDMDFDPSGRLWVAGHTSLGYLDPDNDEISIPHKISGFSGVGISSLGVDVQGNVWLGSNNGAYRFALKNGSPDTLTSLHLTKKEGLISNEIYDLGIDSIHGMVWFGHDLGITRYTRKDLRKADSFMTDNSTKKVIAYPNPFKPKIHEKMIIDNIAEGARVQVFNAGGSLVRSFANDELLGGRLEWDGRDLHGRLVAPGLYHYFVKNGSKREKGKILIIH